eukprot:6491685-Amphidinium_carterae.1
MLREAEKQQDVLMRHARNQLENVQHQPESLRGQAAARDASVQQLAAEKIRATQLESHCANTLQCKELVRTFTGHIKHPKVLQILSNKRATSEDAGIHMTPPFATQSVGPSRSRCINDIPVILGRVLVLLILLELATEIGTFLEDVDLPSSAGWAMALLV